MTMTEMIVDAVMHPAIWMAIISLVVYVVLLRIAERQERQRRAAKRARGGG